MVKQFCCIVSLKAKPAWLKLDRDTRTAHWNKVGKIIQEFAGAVSFQYHDADAFHADYSDFAICETPDLVAYHHMWDRLKDTELFTQGFYEISDVRIGIKGVSHG